METSWLIAIDGSAPSLKVMDYVITEATNRLVKPQLIRCADAGPAKACSLIMMGAHGFGSVIGMFMGSVTTKVVRLSPVPVLFVM